MARKQITGGPNALTDAYLAVFAKSVDATVVTFDRRFKDIAGANIFVVPQV
jgi:predicted nucleic acid-binding protein